MLHLDDKHPNTTAAAVGTTQQLQVERLPRSSQRPDPTARDYHVPDPLKEDPLRTQVHLL